MGLSEQNQYVPVNRYAHNNTSGLQQSSNSYQSGYAKQNYGGQQNGNGSYQHQPSNGGNYVDMMSPQFQHDSSQHVSENNYGQIGGAPSNYRPGPPAGLTNSSSMHRSGYNPNAREHLAADDQQQQNTLAMSHMTQQNRDARMGSRELDELSP